MAISIESVATEQDLVNELGGVQAALDQLVSAPGTKQTVRQLALNDVLRHLKNRTPPVLEEQLSDLSELKEVVVQGALARIYREAMTTGDKEDINSRKQAIHQNLFDSQLRNLRPTLNMLMRAAPRAPTVHRR